MYTHSRLSHGSLERTVTQSDSTVTQSDISPLIYAHNWSCSKKQRHLNTSKHLSVRYWHHCQVLNNTSHENYTKLAQALLSTAKFFPSTC